MKKERKTDKKRKEKKKKLNNTENQFAKLNCE